MNRDGWQVKSGRWSAERKADNGRARKVSKQSQFLKEVRHYRKRLYMLKQAGDRPQNKANLHRSFTLSPSCGTLGDWSAWMLRVVSRLSGNLIQGQPAAVDRPGRTRKLGLRDG